MNSYYRRLVHNVFVNDPEVMSVSQEGSARFKRIFLKRRPKESAVDDLSEKQLRSLLPQAF
jgi:hypothetical protein